MYTYINNFCHKIQCFIVKEWINIEHEVHDHFFCAKLPIFPNWKLSLINYPCISSTELTLIFGKLTPKAKTPKIHIFTAVRTDMLHKARGGS